MLNRLYDEQYENVMSIEVQITNRDLTTLHLLKQNKPRKLDCLRLICGLRSGEEIQDESEVGRESPKFQVKRETPKQKRDNTNIPGQFEIGV
jgi:hypothetical protein